MILNKRLGGYTYEFVPSMIKHYSTLQAASDRYLEHYAFFRGS